jgi:iron complex outermembrane receptor protein
MVVRSLRAQCSLIVIFASLLGAAAVLPAAAQEVHEFNVSAQDPATAIRAFAAQARLQILASAHDLKGKTLNPVSGAIPTEAALNTLLAGTGLDHRYVGERTVALVKNDAASGNAPQQSVPKTLSSAGFANDSPAASTAHSGPPASAEPENAEKRAEGIGLQEIIVTARRHEEDLQKVPISITALSGEALKQQSVTQVYDLGGQIPGLFMQQARDDPQSLAITMRGRKQEDITLAVDPAVSLNVDGLYIPRTLAMAGALLDINRVEVLRGPQGTLYGRNSTGGAIGLFTNDPTQELSGSADVTFGNYGAFSTTGIANLPITDTLAARFVAQDSGHGGYEHNATGAPVADTHSQYYRAKLGWTGDDGRKAVLSAHYETDHNGIVRTFVSGLTAAGGGFPEGGALTLETAAERGLPVPQALALLNSWVASGKSYDFLNTCGPTCGPPNPGSHGNDSRWDVGLNLSGDVTPHAVFRSITGYQQLQRHETLGGQYPVDLLLSDLFTRDSYVSQEFQLLGETPQFKWVGGIYGGYERGDDDSTVTIIPLVLGPLPGINNNEIRNSSLAGFAQAAWEFIPDWRLTAGARYTADTRQINTTAMSGTTCVVPAPGVKTTANGGAAECPRTFKNTFRKPTWLASLDHQLTPESLLYVKVATGYRSGGENEGGAVDIETFAPFSPETNIEYEAGLKSEFFDRKLRLNLDGYQDKYSNLQVQTALVGSDGQFVTVETNAATSTIRGMELEVDAIIASGLSMHASTAFTDAHYDTFSDATGDRRHEPFSVPKWMWSLSGKYVRPTAVGDLLVQLDYDWKSAVNLAGHAVYASQVTQGAYGLLNARINLHFDARNLDVALFGKNMTNVRYSDQAFTLEQGGFNELYWGAPATFGLEVSMKFGRRNSKGT